MQIASILSPERTFCNVEAASRKRVFEQLAEVLSEKYVKLKTSAVLEAMMARERLGSTGLGKGIAIPHCRIEGCEESTGALLTLSRAIDFDAPDQQAVDLLFVLMVPAEADDEHLQILAALAKRFHEGAYCAAIRAADTQQALYQAAISLDEGAGSD